MAPALFDTSNRSSTSTSTTTSSPLPQIPKMSEKSKRPEVRQVGIECYKEVALSLAKAFAKDELSMYFLTTPDDAWRTEEQVWQLHLEIMEYIVAAHCYNGLVYTIGENHEGVALWMPPGCNMDDYFTIFRSGMWRLWYKLSAEGRKRYFDEFLNVLHDAKTEVMGERDANSWYLVYLGVVPEAQKQGYARKLLEHSLRRIDAQGCATYLESSNVVNVPIYERFGFTVKRRVCMTRAEKEVALDIMVREPQTMVVSKPTRRPRSNTEKLLNNPPTQAIVKRYQMAAKMKPKMILCERV